MFSQNNEEKKLDWMYKGPNSTVDREEYLLGRSVDKTLEQLNAEEKQKQSGVIQPPKNHVEHECIPPSIRDYKKQQEAEQVDLSAKLQEDPLVAIKKREEETRRQFLQNPVQLKKLQKALKAQEALKRSKKKKKSRHSDDDLDRKIAEKLRMLKGNPRGVEISKKKSSIKEKDLDTILMHKFNQLKDKLSDGDMRDILAGKYSGTDSSSDDSNTDEKSSKKKHKKDKRSRKKEKKSGRDDKKDSERVKERKRKSSSSSDSSDHDKKRRRSSSDSKKPKQNWGLVKSDGTKIPLYKKIIEDNKNKTKPDVTKQEVKSERHKSKRLTEEEKQQKLKEMMRNASWRDKEREKNVKRYREDDSREAEQRDFDKDFLHKQLVKSANSSSVESRIKSNINNIQRSKSDMNTHFSRRH